MYIHRKILKAAFILWIINIVALASFIQLGSVSYAAEERECWSSSDNGGGGGLVWIAHIIWMTTIPLVV